MTFANGALVAMFAAASLWATVLHHSLSNAEQENADLSRDLQTQTQARNTAEWLLDSQTQAMQVFAAIRTANQAARLHDEKQRHDAKQTITEAVAPDECGARAVPAVAADELRRLEDYARAVSGFTPAN